MLLKSNFAEDLMPFESLAKKLGITVEYISQEQNTKENNNRGRDSLKEFWMSPDFDEPLDDFKEYMY
jgi:hypothetical protein